MAHRNLCCKIPLSRRCECYMYAILFPADMKAGQSYSGLLCCLRAITSIQRMHSKLTEVPGSIPGWPPPLSFWLHFVAFFFSFFGRLFHFVLFLACLLCPTSTIETRIFLPNACPPGDIVAAATIHGKDRRKRGSPKAKCTFSSETRPSTLDRINKETRTRLLAEAKKRRRKFRGMSLCAPLKVTCAERHALATIITCSRC